MHEAQCTCESPETNCVGYMGSRFSSVLVRYRALQEGLKSGQGEILNFPVVCGKSF